MTDRRDNHLPDADALQALRAMREQGKSYDDIGREFGLSMQAVRRILLFPDRRLREMTVLRLRRGLEAYRGREEAAARG